jgi:hypothetical protein
MELIDVTPQDSIVPIFVEELSATEKKKREEDLAKGIAEEAKLKQDAENKVAARQSALAKLAKLGLTEEEISAL